MTKRYINVAYDDREMAKRLGARWDASVKRWYCPPGSALAKVYSWRNASRPARTDMPSAALMTPPAHVKPPKQTHGQLSLLG